MTIRSSPALPGGMIADANNECYLSMASCWEMAIKSSLGKLRFSKPVGHFVSEQLAINGFLLIPIELRHVAKIEKLPFHHRDPFDRLLIAQAVTEKLTIVTADGNFSEIWGKNFVVAISGYSPLRHLVDL